MSVCVQHSSLHLYYYYYLWACVSSHVWMMHGMFARVVAWQHVIGARLWLENDAMTHDRWERLLTVMGRVYRQSDIQGAVLIKPGPCFELVWRAVINITCIRSLHFHQTYHTGWIWLHLHTLAHFYACSLISIRYDQSVRGRITGSHHEADR